MATITDLDANTPETPEQPEGEAPIEALDLSLIHISEPTRPY